MPPPKPTLDDLRREIDEIDAALHHLVMRRTEVVQRIAKTKVASSSAMRPGREAAILRGLAAQHAGAFPVKALARIWREMIGALTRLQQPFVVAAFAPDGMRGYWDLARDHYGSTAPIQPVATSLAAFRAVAEGTATVSVVPWPDEEDPDPWWRYLFSEDPKIPRVIARLPFVARAAGRGEEPDALALAALPPEETGQDHTLLGVELCEDTSRGRLKDCLEAVGLVPTLFRTHHLADGRGSVHLALIEEFVAKDDPRLAQFAERMGEALVRVLPLGSYATPIVVPEGQKT